MKRLVILFIIAIFAATYSISLGDVVINEVMIQADEDLQWIELFNAGSEDVEMDGWIVANHPLQEGAKSRDLVLPLGTVIPAGGYLILINDLDDSKDHDGGYFADLWTVPAGVQAIEYGSEFPQLKWDIGGDDLHLSADGRNDIDAMWYGHGGEMGSSQAAPLASEGTSLGRNPNGHDTGEPAADFARFSHPTPGVSNQGAPVTQRSTWSKIKLLFR